MCHGAPVKVPGIELRLSDLVANAFPDEPCHQLPVLFFCLWTCVFSTLLTSDALLLIGLGTSVEDHLSIVKDLFLGSPFCSIGLRFCVYATTIQF